MANDSPLAQPRSKTRLARLLARMSMAAPPERWGLDPYLYTDANAANTDLARYFYSEGLIDGNA
jgi:hypothetical protein